MHAGGNAAAVIDDDHATVDLKGDLDGFTEAGHVLVNTIVDDFIHQMMEPIDTRAADVHGGTLPHRVQTFEHLDLVRAITVRLPLRRICPSWLFHIFCRHSSPSFNLFSRYQRSK